MKLLRSIPVLCLLALGAFANSSEIIKVTLPHAIQVAGNHLAPGGYVIRSLDTNVGEAVLVFESDKGVKVAVAAMRIPEPLNAPADKTELVLRREGDTLTLQKIWIQDEDYGYEFLPAR
jgi:hypothetical protein